LLIAFQIKIGDLSWSTVGGTLAVGLSHIYHEAWCDHLSTIHLYNLTTDDDLTDTPTKTLETNGCVTTLCYHPTEPSILAAGLSNCEFPQFQSLYILCINAFSHLINFCAIFASSQGKYWSGILEITIPSRLRTCARTAIAYPRCTGDRDR